MHPIGMQEIAKARQSDLLREAGQRRLVRQARTGQPGLTDLFLKRLGDLLTGVGDKLKERHVLQRSGALPRPINRVQANINEAKLEGRCQEATRSNGHSFLYQTKRKGDLHGQLSSI